MALVLQDKFGIRRTLSVHHLSFLQHEPILSVFGSDLDRACQLLHVR